ncbi:MAG: hypothetical protein WC413_03625 [Candidatus Nanoarchaeia archaeon]
MVETREDLVKKELREIRVAIIKYQNEKRDYEKHFGSLSEIKGKNKGMWKEFSLIIPEILIKIEKALKYKDRFKNIIEEMDAREKDFYLVVFGELKKYRRKLNRDWNILKEEQI